MKFSKSIVELIKERTSRRTYDSNLLEEGAKKSMSKFLKFDDIKSPFREEAGKCRFELVAVPEFDPKEKRKLGTYGLIKGAQEFIVGAVERSPYAKEHFGFLMEYLIFAATDMGLGTCWLGGTFNRGLFGSKINVKPEEIVPAITPIGTYPEKRRLKERVVRKVVKADQRLPWNQLFFKGDWDTPLNQDAIGQYATLLEMVRLGPSAGNKQSWRILKESNREIYHFYHLEFEGNYRPFPPLDIGIVVCHWDLTAEELGVVGKWVFNQPEMISRGLTYTITWMGE